MGENKKFVPMNIGDILDYTIKIYKTYFLKLFLSGVVFFIPFTVALIIADSQGLFLNFKHHYYRNYYMNYYINNNINNNINDKNASMLILIMFIFAVIFALIYVPAVIKLTSEILMDRNIKILDAYKYSCKKIGSYFLTKLLALIVMWLIIIGLTVIFMISFGIISAFSKIFVGGYFFSDGLGLGVAIVFAIIIYILTLLVMWIIIAFPYGFNLFVSAAFVIGNIKYGSAIKEGLGALWFKCWRYLVGSFVISVIISVPVMISYFVGYAVYDITGIASLLSVISMLGFSLVQPIFFIMITVFFYDYKIRKQGFGIEVEINSLNDNDFKEV